MIFLFLIPFLSQNKQKKNMKKQIKQKNKAQNNIYFHFLNFFFKSKDKRIFHNFSGTPPGPCFSLTLSSAPPGPGRSPGPGGGQSPGGGEQTICKAYAQATRGERRLKMHNIKKAVLFS
jgi:hypothetical protein